MSKDEIWQEIIKLLDRILDTNARISDTKEHIEANVAARDWHIVKSHEERLQRQVKLLHSQIKLCESYLDLYYGVDVE